MSPVRALKETFQAVLSPEAQKAKQGEHGALEAYLNGLCDKMEMVNSVGRQTRFFIWARAELFYKAIHLASWNAQEGKIVVWDTKDQDIYNPVPLTHWAIEVLASEYSKIRPRIVPHLATEDRAEEAMMKDLEYAAECLQYKYWGGDPEARQREAKLLIMRGAVFSLLEQDKNAGQQIQVAQYGMNQGMMPGMAMCPACGASEEIEEMQEHGGICPECGQPGMQIGAPQQMQMAGIQGYQQGRTGDIKRTFVDPFQVELYDHGSSIEESPWLIFSEMEFISKVKQEYPWVDIGAYVPNDGGRKGYSGLHFQNELKRVISNSGELDQSSGNVTSRMHTYFNELMCHKQRTYLDRHVYADFTVDRDIELPGSADVVPKGAKLGDVFDEGLIIHRINGRPVKLDNINKNKIWACCKYTTPGAGFYGPGIAPIISLNKGYDEMNSIELQWCLMASLGITIVDERLKSVENRAGLHVAEDRRSDESLPDMIYHQVTPGPGAEVGNLKQNFKENIVDLSNARNANTSGMSPRGMGTATGVQYQEATSNAISAPKAELYSAYMAKIIGQAIEMERQVGLMPKYYSKPGAKQGSTIDPAQIPEDIDWRVEDDSHQPRTLEDQRREFGIGLSMGIGSGKLDPTIDEYGRKLFRMPNGTDGYPDWASKGEHRLEEMKEAAPVIEQAAQQGQTLTGDPVMDLIQLAGAMPQEIDNHQMFQRFYVELYLKNEFKQMPQILQAAILRLFQLHKMATVAVQAGDMKMASDATAPIRQQAQAEQQQAQAGQIDEARNQQLEDQGMADDQAERQRQHEIQLAQIKANQQGQK